MSHLGPENETIKRTLNFQPIYVIFSAATLLIGNHHKKCLEVRLEVQHQRVHRVWGHEVGFSPASNGGGWGSWQFLRFVNWIEPVTFSSSYFLFITLSLPRWNFLLLYIVERFFVEVGCRCRLVCKWWTSRCWIQFWVSLRRLPYPRRVRFSGYCSKQRGKGYIFSIPN